MVPRPALGSQHRGDAAAAIATTLLRQLRNACAQPRVVEAFEAHLAAEVAIAGVLIDTEHDVAVLWGLGAEVLRPTDGAGSVQRTMASHPRRKADRAT